MADRVKLIGLDFGTTTSCAVVASAELRRSAVGRMELDATEEIYRSDLEFTPLDDADRIDLERIERLLDAWLEAGQVQPGELFGGGALLTGLTARKDNAAALVQLVRRRLGDALVVTADDPCLESWLAFMGSCAALSREHPDRFILNLDIGGGTTNIALGRDRQVLRTGCLFLGARHVQVVPGTYRIVKLSRHARGLFNHLGITRGPGAELTAGEVAAIMATYVAILESFVTGKQQATTILSRLEQVPFTLPDAMSDVVVTFSGGVGELIYRHLRGEPWPATTRYGDLGIDLARRIVASSVWADSLRHFRPQSAGRATVYGLLRHTTEVSGSTLYLAALEMLPLVDLPILGRLQPDTTDEQIRDVLTLVRQSSRGGAVLVRLGSHETAAVRSLGERLAQVLRRDAFTPMHPLVLLVEENAGKLLGQYATRWGTLPVRLLVIDEMPWRDAHYVQIGSPREQAVPVSYYGFHPQGGFS